MIKFLLLLVLTTLSLATSFAQQTVGLFSQNANRTNSFFVDSISHTDHFESFLVEQKSGFFQFAGNELHYSDKLYGYEQMIKQPIVKHKIPYNFGLQQGFARIRVNGVHFKSMSLQAPPWSLGLEKDTGKILSLEHYNFDDRDHPLTFNRTVCDTLQIGASKLSSGIFASNLTTKSVILFHDTITSNFDFYGFNLPNRLTLQHLNFKDNVLLDLSTFSHIEGQTCLIAIKATDFSKIRLDYSQFELDREYLGITEIESLYKQLLVNQEQSGYKDGYKKADIELKQLENAKDGWWGAFVNWLQLHWNNYGYGKELIFLNALKIFGLFFALNLIFYGLLLSDGYTITEIQESYNELPKKHWFARGVLYVFYCAFYTGIIFWGLKIDPEKLKLRKNGFLALWILIQYVVGLVVLAYIANIIIGK